MPVIFILASQPYIPIWDIFIIPDWYNNVKVIFMKLKELRQKRGLSQLKLATELNMSQNTISRYETEERQAGYNELIALADYFDVSIDYLLGRTNNPKVNR